MRVEENIEHNLDHEEEVDVRRTQEADDEEEDGVVC